MLNQIYSDSISSQIAVLALQTREKIDWLITMEFSPYTQNIRDFSLYRDHQLTRFTSERPVSIPLRSCQARLLRKLFNVCL